MSWFLSALNDVIHNTANQPLIVLYKSKGIDTKYNYKSEILIEIEILPDWSILHFFCWLVPFGKNSLTIQHSLKSQPNFPVFASPTAFARSWFHSWRFAQWHSANYTDFQTVFGPFPIFAGFCKNIFNKLAWSICFIPVNDSLTLNNHW